MKRMFNIRLLLFFTVLSGMSIASNAMPVICPAGIHPEKDGDSLSAGVLIDTVYCKSDPDQSYALHLPSGYDPVLSWPVVFIFEPGARGSMAAGIFSEASEHLGIIVLASNNSSNRNSYAGSVRAAESMFRDARMRFNVDSTLFFVAGFSGGSRVASNLAIEYPFIKGVIACGAGMYHNTTTHPEFPNTFLYYGIMGRRDMNLQDMMETEERLSELQLSFHMQYIDIKHVWPSAGEITGALAWLRYKSDSTDYDARDYFLEFQRDQIQGMMDEGLYLDAVSRVEFVERGGLNSGLNEQYNQLRSNKIYKKQVRKRKRAFDREQSLQRTYLDALSQYVYTTELRPDTMHTLQWWEGEIRKLINWRNSGDIESSRLADRLLYLLEVHFNEDIMVYQGKGQMDKALFLANLWMKIAPDQSWSRWNVAVVYAAAGEKQKALELIALMVESGDARYSWFRDASEFESLHEEPEYLRLMQILEEADTR